MICALISSVGYAIVAPFQPIEFRKKHIHALWNGPIFTLYSLGVILASPFVAKMIRRVGEANTITIGIAGMGVSLSCFGLTMFFKSTTFVVASALIIRLLQGISSAFIRTTCFAIATNDYHEDKDHVVAQIEAMTGVGMILGPFIGSLLYSATNFEATFSIIGTGIFLLSLIFRLSSPDISREIAVTDGCGENSDRAEITLPLTVSSHHVEEDQTVRVMEEVSIQNLMKRARFSLALLGATVCFFQYCFLEPILSPRLLEFHLSVFQVGLFFGLFSVIYVPSLMIYTHLMPKWVEKRVTIALSVLLSSASFFLVGPSQLLHFPDSLLMIAFGWSLLAATTAFFYVPILPEMVDSALLVFQGQEQAVNDLSSGLFNSFLGIGQLLAPLYGATITNWIGFRLTNDIMGLLGFGFFAVYFVFADVSDAFKMSLVARKASS